MSHKKGNPNHGGKPGKGKGRPGDDEQKTKGKGNKPERLGYHGKASRTDQENNMPTKSPSQQKDEEEEVAMSRKARKAARRKAYVRSEDTQWQSAFDKFNAALSTLGLRIKDVAGDGNCLFRSIADQLFQDPERHAEVRQQVCECMEANRESFEPFVEDDVPFDKYMKSMAKLKTWGGNLELQAASMRYGVNIYIYRFGETRWDIVNHPASAPSITLSYHNADHYSSVRRLEPSAAAASPLSSSASSSSSAVASSASLSSSTASSSSAEPNDTEQMILETTECYDIRLVRRVMRDMQGDIGATITQIYYLREHDHRLARCFDPAASAPSAPSSASATSNVSTAAASASPKNAPLPAPAKSSGPSLTALYGGGSVGVTPAAAVDGDLELAMVLSKHHNEQEEEERQLALAMALSSQMAESEHDPSPAPAVEGGAPVLSPVEVGTSGQVGPDASPAATSARRHSSDNAEAATALSHSHSEHSSPPPPPPPTGERSSGAETAAPAERPGSSSALAGGAEALTDDVAAAPPASAADNASTPPPAASDGASSPSPGAVSLRQSDATPHEVLSAEEREREIQKDRRRQAVIRLSEIFPDAHLNDAIAAVMIAKGDVDFATHLLLEPTPALSDAASKITQQRGKGQETCAVGISKWLSRQNRPSDAPASSPIAPTPLPAQPSSSDVLSSPASASLLPPSSIVLPSISASPSAPEPLTIAASGASAATTVAASAPAALSASATAHSVPHAQQPKAPPPKQLSNKDRRKVQKAEKEREERELKAERRKNRVRAADYDDDPLYAVLGREKSHAPLAPATAAPAVSAAAAAAAAKMMSGKAI